MSSLIGIELEDNSIHIGPMSSAWQQFSEPACSLALLPVKKYTSARIPEWQRPGLATVRTRVRIPAMAGYSCELLTSLLKTKTIVIMRWSADTDPLAVPITNPIGSL